MNSVTLRQLEYAVALADELHFGRAADRCNVSQPGLSTQLRALEDRLGVALFERSKRHVELTAAGRDVVERAKRVLADVQDLSTVADAHAGDVVGSINVAAIPTMAPYVFPSTVATLSKLWPQATLRLSEHRTDDMVAQIAEGVLDLGLLALPVDTANLVVEPLVEESFVLALPTGHPDAVDRPADTQILADLPMLLLEDGHCLRQHALSVCSLAGNVEATEVSSAGLSTLTQMVAAGIGVTLLPKSSLVVEARPGSGIATRVLADTSTGRTLALAWRPSDPRGSLFVAAARRLGTAWAELVR